MNNDSINCHDISLQLLELNAAEALTDPMRQHLAQCHDCSSLYQDILSLNQAIESMPEHDVSDEVFKQTLQSIKAEKNVDKNTKGINPQWATGLAASFVLVAITGLIYNGSISEFQADFSQAPYATESDEKPKTKSKTDRDEPANRQVSNYEESTSVVFIDDSEQSSEVRMRLLSAPAKPAPAVKNTLEEIRAEQSTSAGAGAVLGNVVANMPSSNTQAVADHVLQEANNIELYADVDEQDNLPTLGKITVTGSRIKRDEKESNMGVNPSSSALRTDGLLLPAENEMEGQSRKKTEMLSLDQLLKPVSGGASVLRRDAVDFKQQSKQLAKDKHTEVAVEVESKDEAAATKENVSSPSRKDASDDGLFASVEEIEVADKFGDSDSSVLGGAIGRSAVVANEVATKYLSELQSTENLSFKSASGYWANTYLPGDPNMRWIQAKLKQANGMNNGIGLPIVQQNIQPFDYPNNAALGLYLNSDHNTLNETGPTRMRLQVGIQAGQQKGGHRSALNLAVVLDLGQNESAELKAETKAESKALLSVLLKAKQPADKVAVYASHGGLIIAAEDFRHGPIQVALDKIFNQESTASANGLYQTLTTANAWLKSQDDPNAVLGSSAVLLISANADLAEASDAESVESLVQQNAIDGITLSTVALTGIEQQSELAQLALLGQGHSRVLAGVNDAERLINEELLVSSRAVARALRLQIKLAEDVQLIDVLGSYSLNEVQAQKVRDAEQSLDQRMAKNLGIDADRGKDDDGIQIVIPSYFAGDTHVILLDVLVNKPGPVAEVSAKYKDLIYLKNATSQKNLSIHKGRNNLGPLELNVMKNVLAHRMSQTLKQAGQSIRAGEHRKAVIQLNGLVELYQAMRQHIPTWHKDAELLQDESIIKQYLQLLNSQSAINPKQYQLIADAMSYIGWRKLISHSP